VKKLFSDVKGRKEVGLRTGCLEEYLRLRKRKKQETKNRIVRSSVIQMYFLPNITPIRVVESKRTRFPVKSTWSRREIHTKVWLKSVRRKMHLEDLGIDGRIILK
jgi:hypothetical protein